MNETIKTSIMIIFYIYFTIVDIKKYEIHLIAFIIYGFFAITYLIMNIINKEIIVNHLVINLVIGISFILISLIFNQIIGLGDTIFIFINGLLLTTNQYIIMISSSFFIAFIIGIIIFIIDRKNIKNRKIPFMICFILFYLWRFKCIL